MALYRSKHQSSFFKILLFVLTIAFGLVALSIMYQAMVKGKGFDLRSKAAEYPEKIMKQWEFNGTWNGTTAEGWFARSMTTINPTRLSVNGGFLKIFVGTNPFELRTQVFTNVNLTYIKRFQIRIKVPSLTYNGCPVIVGGAVPKCTPAAISSTPYVYPYTATVYFYRKDDDGYGNITYPQLGAPLVINGVGDDAFHEYSIQFPNTLAAYRINMVKIIFAGIPVLSNVDIDWMRLVNTKLVPTDTPTPTIKPTTMPTPPPGCSYQSMCTLRDQENCPIQLVCWGTPGTTEAPSDVTKTGTVVQDNLENTSGFKLVVSDTEQYRLNVSPEISKDTLSQRLNNIGVQYDLWEQVRSAAGKRVTVTGTIQRSGKTGAQIGIPAGPALDTLMIKTLTILN